ncbi:MAG: gluconate 2-dehydrogenase subunit 3 family protein [Arenicella sp.]
MTFTFSRRRFLLGATAGAVTLAAVAWVKTGHSALDDELVLSIIDTLVPSDEFAGALDVGIGGAFLQYIAANRAWRERTIRVVEHCQSLALKQHRRSFDALSLQQREDLLGGVLSDNTQLIFRIDMLAVRGLIMQWFYRSEPAQKSLNYRLPARYSNYNGAVQ